MIAFWSHPETLGIITQSKTRGDDGPTPLVPSKLSSVSVFYIIGLKYWPDGLYGLPMAASGCPNDPSVNWRLGTLYQDCEDTDPETHHSFSFNLKASIIQGDVERSFCMKTTTFFDSRRKAWPPGKYCIYLSGRSCPLGMTAGWIVWDDENASIPGTSNRNHRNGTLPAGKYDSNT